MDYLSLAMYPASYRGIEFYYVSGTNTAGRKTVVHEFPNKTFRYVEDLGQNLRTFTITGMIKGGLYNIYYLQNKKALEDALNEEGIGILVHPFYGVVNCVCTGYTLTENETEIGSATFEMTFAEANPNIYPRLTGDNSSVIANLAARVGSEISTYIKGKLL